MLMLLLMAEHQAREVVEREIVSSVQNELNNVGGFDNNNKKER